MKRYSYQFILIIFAVLCLSACATTSSRQALNNQDKANIQSNRILLNSTQREIVMQHNNWFNADLPDPYAPMDNGPIVHHNAGMTSPNLISALIITGIKSHQASTAQTAMSPMRNTLENFDFLTYFNMELQNTVAKLPWLKVRKQEIKYNLSGTESNIVAASNENTTLLIGTTYALNSTFRQLEVATYVKLVQKSADNQAPRTLYANNFFFVNRLPEPNENANENKERWIKNNGAMLKTKLRDAASLLSNMISMDIGKTNIETYPSHKLITLRSIDGLKVKGNLIKQQNGYYIVALNDKELYAVNSEDTIN